MTRHYVLKTFDMVDLVARNEDNILLMKVFKEVKKLFEYVDGHLYKLDHYVSADRMAMVTNEVYNRVLASTSDVVLRFKAYVYGTKKDIHDPECEILFKADLYHTHGHWVAPVGAGRTQKEGYPGVEATHRTIIDLDKGTIHNKLGEEVIIQNKEQVLKEMKETITSWSWK